MLNNAFGLIYTGESNMLLRELTYSRSIAAVPFAGRYRCIDFVLSNLVNTGVTNVGVIAQKNYHSLMDHLGPGKEWDLNRKRDGLFILPPFVTRENTGIYRGTVDALRSVMGYIRRSTQRYVILTGSHTVFNTTFTEMINRHIDTGADITIMCNREREQSGEESYEDLRLTMDASGRVSDLELNPFRPKSQYRSCDLYLMEKTLLEYLIEEAAAHANTDFIRDVLVKKINTLKMYGWVYEGRVARMNSLGAYFRHNMEVLEQDVRENLFNSRHPIYTKIKDEVPAVYGTGANVKNSLVADGCIIEGELENCVLFRGVRIGEGAKLTNCIVMQGCEVQEGCELDHVVLDKSVTVRRGRRLFGYDSFPVIIRKGSTV